MTPELQCRGRARESGAPPSLLAPVRQPGRRRKTTMTLALSAHSPGGMDPLPPRARLSVTARVTRRAPSRGTSAASGISKPRHRATRRQRAFQRDCSALSAVLHALHPSPMPPSLPTRVASETTATVRLLSVLQAWLALWRRAHPDLVVDVSHDGDPTAPSGLWVCLTSTRHLTDHAHGVDPAVHPRRGMVPVATVVVIDALPLGGAPGWLLRLPGGRQGTPTPVPIWTEAAALATVAALITGVTESRDPVASAWAEARGWHTPYGSATRRDALGAYLAALAPALALLGGVAGLEASVIPIWHARHGTVDVGTLADAADPPMPRCASCAMPNAIEVSLTRHAGPYATVRTTRLAHLDGLPPEPVHPSGIPDSRWEFRTVEQRWWTPVDATPELTEAWELTPDDPPDGAQSPLAELARRLDGSAAGAMLPPAPRSAVAGTADDPTW